MHAKYMNVFETTVKIYCSQKYLCLILSLGLKDADNPLTKCHHYACYRLHHGRCRQQDRKWYIKNKKKPRRREVSCHRMNVFETTVKICCSQKYLCLILSLGFKDTDNPLTKCHHYTIMYLLQVTSCKMPGNKIENGIYIRNKKKNKDKEGEGKSVVIAMCMHACT